MNAQRHPEELRIEAVKQILEHGHCVADVSRRIGVSTHSLCCSKYPQSAARADRSKRGVGRLKTKLKRVTEERDTLKKAAYFARQPV